MGVPSELADVFIDSEKVQPVITTIATLHGAGIIFHELFSVVLFQPSNDKISGAFKTSMQQIKTPLRAVVYQNWDPTAPPTLAHPTKDLAGFACGQKKSQYIHTLLYQMLGVRCNEILGATKDTPEGLRNFVVYYPELCKPEGLEIENALKALDQKLWNIDDIPRVFQEHRYQKFKITILVIYTSLLNIFATASHFLAPRFIFP